MKKVLYKYGIIIIIKKIIFFSKTSIGYKLYQTVLSMTKNHEIKVFLVKLYNILPVFYWRISEGIIRDILEVIVINIPEI